jgi:hypothetical protein
MMTIINVMMAIYMAMGNCVDIVLNLMDAYPVQFFMAVLVIGCVLGVSLKNWILVVE